MLFTRMNAWLISRNLKTETRRLKKPQVLVGRTYPLRTTFFRVDRRGRLEILEMFRERLGAISDESVKREGCTDRASFFEMFHDINGRVHRNRKVWVIRFRYAKHE